MSKIPSGKRDDASKESKIYDERTGQSKNPPYKVIDQTGKVPSHHDKIYPHIIYSDVPFTHKVSLAWQGSWGFLRVIQLLIFSCFAKLGLITRPPQSQSAAVPEELPPTPMQQLQMRWGSLDKQDRQSVANLLADVQKAEDQENKTELENLRKEITTALLEPQKWTDMIARAEHKTTDALFECYHALDTEKKVLVKVDWNGGESNPLQEQVNTLNQLMSSVENKIKERYDNNKLLLLNELSPAAKSDLNHIAQLQREYDTKSSEKQSLKRQIEEINGGIENDKEKNESAKQEIKNLEKQRPVKRKELRKIAKEDKNPKINLLKAELEELEKPLKRLEELETIKEGKVIKETKMFGRVFEKAKQNLTPSELKEYDDLSSKKNELEAAANDKKQEMLAEENALVQQLREIETVILPDRFDHKIAELKQIPDLIKKQEDELEKMHKNLQQISNNLEGLAQQIEVEKQALQQNFPELRKNLNNCISAFVFLKALDAYKISTERQPTAKLFVQFFIEKRKDDLTQPEVMRKANQLRQDVEHELSSMDIDTIWAVPLTSVRSVLR